MPSYTPNYNFTKPNVNDPTDQDQWGGMLNGNFDSLDSLLKTIQNAAYPVNSLYLSTNSANPASTLGFGTWAAYAQGLSLMGAGTGTDVNNVTQSFTAGTMVGEFTHTLSIAEMPSHNHTEKAGTSGGGTSGMAGAANQNFVNTNATTDFTGGGQAHNNIPPSMPIYVWQRTA